MRTLLVGLALIVGGLVAGLAFAGYHLPAMDLVWQSAIALCS